MKIVAICGMHGSGKTTVKELFAKAGFAPVRLGVRQYVKEKYGETNEELERKEREALRKEKGMAVMAEIALPQIRELLTEGKKVVIENMYSWEEFKLFRKEFGDSFTSIAVIANPKIRYDRVVERNDERVQGFSEEEIRQQSLERDMSVIENINKAGPIAMADFNILNEGTGKELEEQVEKIVSEL